jgi:hypothetical protein
VTMADPVVYTVRVHCADDQVPFWAEVEEHPAFTAFGRDLGELFENVAEGIGALE